MNAADTLEALAYKVKGRGARGGRHTDRRLSAALAGVVGAFRAMFATSPNFTARFS